jgi:hypothetical protein
MVYKKCILEDQRLLRKFCEAMTRHYGCRQAFGTSKDQPYGACKACPLATAEATQYLMNLKNMPMGEAVKATLRGPVSADEAHEILQAYARQPRPYPEEGGE